MWWIVIVWLICEALFYSYINLGYRKTIEKVRNPSRFHLETVKTLEHMRRMCTIIKKVSSIEDFTRGFFCGASVSSLGIDNCLSFIAWAFVGEDLRAQEFAKDKNKDEKLTMVEKCFDLL